MEVVVVVQSERKKEGEERIRVRRKRIGEK